MARNPDEWRIDIYRADHGEVYAVLYEFEEGTPGQILADERFGPFDTAKDLTDWVLRHWGPRAKLQLR